MIEHFKIWYAQLDQREQRILNISGLFVAILFLLFALIKPINDKVEQLQLQVDARARSVNQWEKALPLIVSNRGQGKAGASSQALSYVITSSTNKYGLRVSRVQEKSSDEIQVWFDNIPFNEFVRWLAEIQGSHQISVASLNIRSKDRNGLSSIDIKIKKS